MPSVISLPIKTSWLKDTVGTDSARQFAWPGKLNRGRGSHTASNCSPDSQLARHTTNPMVTYHRCPTPYSFQLFPFIRHLVASYTLGMRGCGANTSSGCYRRMLARLVARPVLGLNYDHLVTLIACTTNELPLVARVVYTLTYIDRPTDIWPLQCDGDLRNSTRPKLSVRAHTYGSQ